MFFSQSDLLKVQFRFKRYILLITKNFRGLRHVYRPIEPDFRSSIHHSQTHTMLRQAIRRYSSLPPHALKPAFGPADKAAAKAFKETTQNVKHHAKETSSLWIKITWFVAAPAVALAAVNTYFVEAEHASHREHLKHVSDQDWPRDYDFQNIRTKPFFWGDGDKTLFWNPVINRHISHD